MTFEELKAATKQALGQRSSTNITDTWYGTRVNNAYRRLCTFQGIVAAVRPPGTFRVLRFHELEHENDRDLTTALTTNFVTLDATIYAIRNLYDLTNDRPLRRYAMRELDRRDPDTAGVPYAWCPGGQGGVLGYYIYPRPQTSAQEIEVRERLYLYPTALSADDDEPVIPEEWHQAIWQAAASEGALLIDWSEKHAEMESRFMQFIAERRSPGEENDSGGGRRYFMVGT